MAHSVSSYILDTNIFCAPVGASSHLAHPSRSVKTLKNLENILRETRVYDRLAQLQDSRVWSELPIEVPRANHKLFCPMAVSYLFIYNLSRK